MRDWLNTLMQKLTVEPAVVRVMVVATHGSVPREAGACMLVGADQSSGTIGGGHLEWKAEEIARNMLSTDMTATRLDRFTLGATLGQCCGGAVELWFERFVAEDRAAIIAINEARCNKDAEFLLTTFDSSATSRQTLNAKALQSAMQHMLKLDAPLVCVLPQTDGGTLLVERITNQTTPIWLYGAGHVGHALVKVLADLPCNVTWIDNRADLFPSVLPENVRVLISEFPADEVGDAPDDALHLVMTHRHDFDYDICRALLKRGYFRWAGMIGSDSKAASFCGRLRREGFTSQQIARLVCPIGVEGIDSKLPAAIAVSVAAQLLQLMGESVAQQGTHTQPQLSERRA